MRISVGTRWWSRHGVRKLLALGTLAALTVTGCASAPVRPHIHGTVLFESIPGTTATVTGRPATVYLPPGAAGRSLPVVELLHEPLPGSGSWLHISGLKAIATIYAAAHHGAAPIIVIPGMRQAKPHPAGCPTQHDRDLEKYLVDDVPAYLRAHYGTSTGPQNWTIAGLAGEGTYAVALGLRHPNVFGNFADLSGRARRTDSNHRPAWLLRHNSYPTVRGWFESGRHDARALRAQDRLVNLARGAGMTVHSSTVTGANGWTAWRTSLRQLLPWTMSRAAPSAPSSGASSSGGAPHSSPPSRLSSGHASALRRSRSVRRLPQCARSDRSRRADHRRSHPQRTHRSA